jgi:hypothetical protein
MGRSRGCRNTAPQQCFWVNEVGRYIDIFYATYYPDFREGSKIQVHTINEKIRHNDLFPE